MLTRALLVIVLLAALGCDKSQEIRRYTVDKPVVVDTHNRGNVKHNPPIADPLPDKAPHRMLGAMIVHDEDIWFFKTVGKTAEMTKVVAQALDLVRSVRFEGETPTWKKPDAWAQKLESASSIRYATLTAKKGAEGESDIEVTVTRLSLPLAVDLDSVLLSNLNRWRKQLRLSKILRNRLFRPKADGDEAAARKQGVLLTEWVDGRRIYFADLAGTFTPQMRPGSPHGGGPAPRNVPPANTPPVVSDEFTYEAGKNWKTAPLRPFGKLSFQADGTAITVSVAGGDMLSNVNRWRGQVQLKPISASELKASGTQVPVGKLTGDFFELKGPSRSILAVVLPRGPQKWFFKVTGPTTAAIGQKEAFLGFVKSFQFK